MSGESKHILNSYWNLWYHDPQNSKWDLESYQKIYGFNTVEHYWALHKNIKNEMLNSGMFFLMRNDIAPIWEDLENINGGCWSFKIVKKEAIKAWIQISVALISESISKDSLSINGISISPKKGFCIIKIWNNDKNKSDISYLASDIPFFSNQEHIYKAFS